MARNKKVEILSNDKEVLHPMTDGDCVIFEDGQTLAQKLSEDDSVKYTPVIVNSSPMFKVGEGNTVDYSDNVLDGAYEHATLQGQTYTNYIQESSADEVTLPTPFTEYERTQHNTLTSNEEGTLGINLVGQSYVNALQHDSEEEFVVLGESLEFQEKKVEYTNEGQIKSAMLKGQTLINLIPDKQARFDKENVSANTFILWENNTNVQLIKPNTKYLLIANITRNVDTRIIISNAETANNPCIVYDSMIYDFGETGIKKAIVTSVGDVTNCELILRSYLLSHNNNSNVNGAGTIQLIEYQEGMENWDIPYFEGMQSVTVSTRLENKVGTYSKTASIAKNGMTFTTTSSTTRTLVILGASDASTNPLNFKPNTKYLIYFQISNLVLDGLSEISLAFSVSSLSSGNCLFVGEDGTSNSRVSITSNGIYRIVRTTTDLITSSTMVIKGQDTQWENSGSTLRSLTISNIMYVEYQNGMENWDLPYFEDYQVMKPVQVESVNKNEFNTRVIQSYYACTPTIHNDNSFTLVGANDDRQYKNLAFIIDVKPNTMYKLSYEVEYISGEPNALYDIYTMDNKYYAHGNGEPFNSGNNTQLSIRFYACAGNGNIGTIRYYNVQLEESDTATSFVPHQSKTTYSWDEVILRKVGDVEDTLDLTTGEWVQRIGEIVLDGSEDELWKHDRINTAVFVVKMALSNTVGVTGGNGIANILCKDYVSMDGYNLYNDNVEGIAINGRGEINLAIKREKLIGNTTDSVDVSHLKTYLKQNPITVQYELASPIVHKVNLSRPNLQVYDDITHVHTKCLDGTLIPNIYLPSDVSYPAILEPGKKYNVCVNHTEVSADNPLKVNVGGTEITMTDSRMTLITPTTLANSNVSFTGKGNKIKESMLIKNSSLLTRDLPHFNGIGSVQLGKTIENLCSSKYIKGGNGKAQANESDDTIQVTITTKGSYVLEFPLLAPLENGKTYFCYAPLQGKWVTYSFVTTYDNIKKYTNQPNSDGGINNPTHYIINIDQKNSQYVSFCMGSHGPREVGETFIYTRPIICEYEPGMENWDWESIGYFTGTKNIGNEFMKVQNKNLFTSKNLILGANQYWASEEYIINANHTLRATLSQLIQVTPGCTLTLTFGSNYQGVIQEYISGDKRTHYTDGGWQNDIHTLKLNEKTKYVNIYFRKIDDTKFTTDELNVLKNSIQLEESSTATTYTVHKYNGLYITKDQPINLTWEQGQVLVADFGDTYTSAINNTLSTRIRNKGLLNLKPNTTYRVSLGDKTNYKYHIACFDNQDFAEHTITGIATGWVSSTDTIFTTTKDMHKIGINVAKIGDGAITPSESVHAQVRLEEVTDVVLRSCSGKYDELDLTRGTYTQNVGVVYADGVNQYCNYITVVGDSYQPTDTTLKTFDIRCDGAVVDSICLSNRFPMRESMTSTNINFESVRIHSTNSSCRLTIKKEKASTLEEFKLWLQDNPLEIIYALKTPIVHKVHIGNKNETNTEITKPNDVFTLPTLYTEQTHIDLTNNGIMPKVQSRDYIAYPVLPMVSRTYTLQHNLIGGVSNLTIDLLGRTQSVSYQNHKSLVYTPETMDAILHNELRISGKGKISRVMYIDGGYMDREIPYIEGMKNAVNPIVKNVGKNLVQKIDNIWYFYENTINHGEVKHNCGIAPVKPYTQYIINKNSILCFYDENGKCTNSPFQYFNANIPRTAPSGSKYMLVRHNGGDNATYLDGLQVVEYGQEFDNQEYKENICYVDCGEIRLTPDMFEQGSIYSVQAHVGLHYNDDKVDGTARIRTKELIDLEPGEQYVFLGDPTYLYSMHFYDKNGMKVGFASPYDLSWKGNVPFTIRTDAPKAAIFICKANQSSITPSELEKINFQLVKVSEIKQLRSLPHGVHDEIDLETGKYIQRVGEVVLDGSSDEQYFGFTIEPSTLLRSIYLIPNIKMTSNLECNFMCDSVPSVVYGNSWNIPYKCFAPYYSTSGSGILIYLPVQNETEFKQYLQQNSITVQYELVKPIVKDIVIHNYPHSYEGGHVIIESGDPNTPIPAQLTYRAVTNRSGQIQQHTEQVEKQEREINELETLILANIHLSQTR